MATKIQLLTYSPDIKYSPSHSLLLYSYLLGLGGEMQVKDKLCKETPFQRNHAQY